MRLLHTGTLNFHWFNDSKRPPYVILSHTWASEEVSLQDMQGSHDKIQVRQGYVKILKCCAQAARDGFQYVWIDTCCIDKTNSTEFSEAINSMFKWYQNAFECYVFLADVLKVSDISESRWFTRGWTLQEILAPQTLIFFGGDWQELGTKDNLYMQLSKITHTPTSALLSTKPLGEFCIAQRMSWASRRVTTRLEDEAYCLLGIFDITMPMLYGEGHNAFTRLQLEIIKNSTDQSLFAWSDIWSDGRERGPLALSSGEFQDCGAMKHARMSSLIPRQERLHTVSELRPYQMTNCGLSIELPIQPLGEPGMFCALLNCTNNVDDDDDSSSCVAIQLKKTASGSFVRVIREDPLPNLLLEKYEYESLYFSGPRTYPSLFERPYTYSTTSFNFILLNFESAADEGYDIGEKYLSGVDETLIPSTYSSRGKIYFWVYEWSITVALMFTNKLKADAFVVILSATPVSSSIGFRGAIITNVQRDETLKSLADEHLKILDKENVSFSNRRACRITENKIVNLAIRKVVVNSHPCLRGTISFGSN